MFFHVWTENMWNPNSPADVYIVGQNGDYISGFLQVEEYIMGCLSVT